MGISIIEVVTAIAIVLLLVLLSTSGALSFGKTSAVRTSARTLATTLDEARARTLASETASRYGVHVTVGASEVTLFRGGSYDPADPANETFLFDPRVAIASTTLGGTADVVFTRLSGTTTPVAVVVSHTSDASTTQTVTVQGTGLIVVGE